MKVALINTSDAGGGAAEACMRLLKALQLQGVEASLVVQHKKRDDPAVHSIERTALGRLRSQFNFLYERLPFIAFQERDRSVRFAFSTANAGTDISREKVIQEADILHLHWTNAGFLSVKDLTKLMALGKPVVWTLHDMWAFTGGCHYAGTCDHYTKQCGNCYFLRNPDENDISHTGWLRKNSLFGKAERLAIVTCSNWMAGMAKQSSLLKHLPVQAIPNPIDTAVFSPQDKLKAREKWGISADSRIILFGAANINDRRKGISYLVEALQHLKNNYPQEKIEVVIFGKNKHFDVSTLSFPVQQLNIITSPAELAEIYSMADVYVSPAVEDNLPNTIMEAMACGTPAVAFNTGGIPDLIDHQVNGYLAGYRSSEDLAKGLHQIFNTPDKAALSAAARDKVLREFNNQKVAGQYRAVYESFTGGQCMKPVLSVITVVYNNVQDIERTMLSVLNQTYEPVEYLVIDGLSNDGTAEVIKRYENRFGKFISEKDNGIYDAMNKGLAMATGDYIIFMNSGDEFYDTGTVATVFTAADGADIYYGETEMVNSKRESLGRRRHHAPEHFTWQSFNYGMSVSHQAIYIKRSLTETFDTRYQLSADIDWIIRAAKKAKKIVNVHAYVAKYLVGGMSKTKHRQSLSERFNIMKTHYGLAATVFNHLVIAVNLGWYWLKNRHTND